MLSVVVGLGNPGDQYEDTRHNIGFRVVECLAARRGAPWRLERKFQAAVAETNLGSVEGPRIRGWLVKPLTYMNASGEAVLPLLNYFKLGLDSLLAVVDDTALPLGRLRLRASGSSGGHNGLLSIERSARSAAFARLRVGVGAPAPGRDLTGHVLGAFLREEMPLVETAIDRASEAVDCACTLGLDSAMAMFNRPDPAPVAPHTPSGKTTKDPTELT